MHTQQTHNQKMFTMTKLGWIIKRDTLLLLGKNYFNQGRCLYQQTIGYAVIMIW